MAKRLAKIVTMGVLIIMNLGLFAGCGGSKNFVVSYDKRGRFGNKDIDDGTTMYTLEMVSSSQELKDLCDTWNNPAFQESSEHYSSELGQKIRSYDEAFNWLILIEVNKADVTGVATVQVKHK